MGETGGTSSQTNWAFENRKWSLKQNPLTRSGSAWWPSREVTIQDSCYKNRKQVNKWKDPLQAIGAELRLEVLNCTFTDLNQNTWRDSIGLNEAFLFFFETISSPAIRKETPSQNAMETLLETKGFRQTYMWKMSTEIELHIFIL